MGNIRVKKTTLLYTMCVFGLVEPNYFKVIASINRIYTVVRIAVAVYILFLLIKMCKKVVKNKLILFFILLYVPLLVSTIIYGNRINEWYKNSISSILLSALIILAFLNETENSLLKALQNLDIYLIINFLTIVFYPKGLYKTELYTECWFLGYKNPQIRIVLPIMVFSVIYNYRNYGKLQMRTRIDILVAALTTVMVGSSTGIVGMALCLAMFAVITNKSVFAYYVKKVLNYKVVALAIGCIFVFVIWKGSRSNELLLYVADFFDKGVSFFTRVDFWGETVQLIIDSPVWGYGYLTSADFELLIGNPYAAHPHNYFLYILCCGGIICFAGIIFVIYYIFKSAYQNENKAIGAITMAYLTSLLVMGLAESLTEFVLLYPSLILVLRLGGPMSRFSISHFK